MSQDSLNEKLTQAALGAAADIAALAHLDLKHAVGQDGVCPACRTVADRIALRIQPVLNEAQASAAALRIFILEQVHFPHARNCNADVEEPDGHYPCSCGASAYRKLMAEALESTAGQAFANRLCIAESELNSVWIALNGAGWREPGDVHTLAQHRVRREAELIEELTKIEARQGK